MSCSGSREASTPTANTRIHPRTEWRDCHSVYASSYQGCGTTAVALPSIVCQSVATYSPCTVVAYAFIRYRPIYSGLSPCIDGGRNACWLVVTHLCSLKVGHTAESVAVSASPSKQSTNHFQTPSAYGLLQNGYAESGRTLSKGKRGQRYCFLSHKMTFEKRDDKLHTPQISSLYQSRVGWALLTY